MPMTMKKLGLAALLVAGILAVAVLVLAYFLGTTLSPLPKGL